MDRRGDDPFTDGIGRSGRHVIEHDTPQPLGGHGEDAIACGLHRPAIEIDQAQRLGVALAAHACQGDQRWHEKPVQCGQRQMLRTGRWARLADVLGRSESGQFFPETVEVPGNRVQDDDRDGAE